MDQPQTEHARNDDLAEPRQHTHLRWLVTALTATMIIGLIVVVTLIVMIFLRQPDASRTEAPQLPPAIQVPEGESVISITQGPDWNALVTRDRGGADRLHLFSPETGEIYRTIEIDN